MIFYISPGMRYPLLPEQMVDLGSLQELHLSHNPKLESFQRFQSIISNTVIKNFGIECEPAYRSSSRINVDAKLRGFGAGRESKYESGIIVKSVETTTEPKGAFD